MIPDAELSEIQELLEPGEELGEVPNAGESFRPDGEPISEYLYDFRVIPIDNSTYAGGSSVVLEVGPGGAVEPVLITGDITLRVKVLRGCGAVVMHNMYTNSKVRVVEVDTDAEPVELVSGDAYAFLNRSETDPLTLRDNCSPAFKGFEEFQLAVAPLEEEIYDDNGVLSKHPTPDGRNVKLPVAFWLAFVR